MLNNQRLRPSIEASMFDNPQLGVPIHQNPVLNTSILNPIWPEFLNMGHKFDDRGHQ